MQGLEVPLMRSNLLAPRFVAPHMSLLQNHQMQREESSSLGNLQDAFSTVCSGKQGEGCMLLKAEFNVPSMEGQS